MKKRIFLLLKVFLVSLSILCLSCTRKEEKPQEIISLRLSTAFAFITAPVLIAQNQDYFFEEGIDLQISGVFNSGREAFEHMLAGGSDVSIVATTPLVINSFQRDDYSIILTYTTAYEAIKVIARSDKGIIHPRDLKGKRIAIVKDTISDILLDSLLTYNKILREETIIIPMDFENILSAIQNDQVDAISIWEPLANYALLALGENGIKIPTSKVYRSAINFAAMNHFIKDNPETIRRLTKAMIKAVKYIKENKESAQKIIAESLDLDIHLIKKNWEETQFDITLDQLLLITMENEAHWFMRNFSLDHSTMPNYLDFIYYEILEEIDPESVTIVRGIR